MIKVRGRKQVFWDSQQNSWPWQLSVSRVLHSFLFSGKLLFLQNALKRLHYKEPHGVTMNKVWRETQGNVAGLSRTMQPLLHDPDFRHVESSGLSSFSCAFTIDSFIPSTYGHGPNTGGDQTQTYIWVRFYTQTLDKNKSCEAEDVGEMCPGTASSCSTF